PFGDRLPTAKCTTYTSTMDAEEECCECGGEGIVDFTDEEWVAMYGVPQSEYKFTGKEPETMKTCSNCNGLGVLPQPPLL
ncbi:MAG: hypothetical protein ACXABY_16425, partial [Candidatus Thorarchaeota archaeon]